MLIAPVAYVDLTDIYRIPSRRHRVMTCLAGIYIELTIASIAIFLLVEFNLSDLESLLGQHRFDGKRRIDSLQSQSIDAT